MLNTKSIFTYLLVALFFLFTGCMDLAVENTNQPDRTKAIQKGSDVETLVSSSFLQWWQSTNISYSASLTTSVIADVHTSSWGNWGMNELSTEPRIALNNTSGWSYSGDIRNMWAGAYRGISQANDGITFIKGGLKILDASNVDQTNRALAFSHFVRGIAHGWIGLVYDKGFIVDAPITDATKLELKPYTEMVAQAYKDLDECIRLCSGATFIVPKTWINGLEIPASQLAQLAYSFKARIRSGVGRLPAERAAADWNAIMSDAQKGITADFAPIGDNNYWWDGFKYYGNDTQWSRADYKLIGLTDTSGAYAAWLAQPPPSRVQFDMKSGDERIHLKGDGKKDGTDFKYGGPASFNATRGSYHFSHYYHNKYSYLKPQALGPMPAFKTVELDLLVAEGKLRAGSKTEAATLINKTRVGRGKLPALTGAEATDELWKWLKYEKLLENMTVAAGTAWFDRRGWGDLLPGSLTMFPIPARELELLIQPNYTFGGTAGQLGSAPKRWDEGLTSFQSVRSQSVQ